MPVIGDPLGFVLETANPWLGEASLYWLGRPGESISKLLDIEVAAWGDTDKPPFAWCVIKHPLPSKTRRAKQAKGSHAQARGTRYPHNAPPENYHSLILFLAPHVRLTYASESTRIPIQAIRLDDRRSVPSYGQAVQLGDYLGEIDLNVLADGNVTAQNDFAFLGCKAYRSGLSIVICYANAGLEIHIELSDRAPCLHELQFFCERSFHHVWCVGTTSDVEVKVIQKRLLELVNPPARQMMEFVRVYRYAISSSEVAELRAPAGAVAKYFQSEFPPPYFKWVATASSLAEKALRPIDPSRAYFGGGDFQRVEVIEENSFGRTVFLSAIDLAIGFTFVGTAADLIQIACMVTTGKDYWGQPVEQTEIGLTIAFTLLGGFGDLLKGGAHIAECLGELEYLNRSVFSTVQLVSLNPGPSAAFFGRVFDSLSPALIKAAERVITKKSADELLGDLIVLRRAARRGDSVSISAFTKTMASALQAELEALARVAFIHEAPAFQTFVLDNRFLSHSVFDEIDHAMASTLRKRIADARALGNGAGLYEYILKLEPKVARALRDRVRSMTWDRVRSHPGLCMEYKRYVLKYPNAKSFDDWVLTLTNGKPRQSLRYAFSDQVVTFLREEIAQAEGLPPVDELILNPEMIEKIAKLIGRMDSYEYLREAVEAAAPGRGLGRILNADHMIEKRVRVIAKTGMHHTSTYLSKLVVSNPQIAEKLASMGLSALGDYIHAAKTTRLQQLLPHNQEVAYSVQAIADAHQLFFVVENGMPFSDFVTVFGPEFRALADDAGSAFTALRPRSAQELLLRIRDGRLIELGESKVYERVVGARASRSIR